MNEQLRNRVRQMKSKSLLFSKPDKEFYTIVALGNTGILLANLFIDVNKLYLIID
jgi:hypothetical protein